MSVTITNIVEELQSRIDALTANDSNSDLLKLFSAVKISSEQVIRGYDNVSDLPAATSNNQGYIYWINNENALYVSNGQNWSIVSGSSVYYAGSNIDITNNTITNTAPDQTVTLTGGSNVTISGTYPNFTISSTDNTGIALTNLSVTQNAASGGGSLIYDNTTGNFSFTPPDLSNLQGGSGGIQLTNLAVTQNTASGTGTLTYDNTTGNFTYTPPELFSGDYTDLTNKPTNLSDFVNDVGYITSQTDSQTLSLVGTTLSISNGNNVDLSALGGANVNVSDTNPSNPASGDLWWKSDEGVLKIYYNDSSSSQWVDAVPQGNSSSTSITWTRFYFDRGGVTPTTVANSENVGKNFGSWMETTSSNNGTTGITPSNATYDPTLSGITVNANGEFEFPAGVYEVNASIQFKIYNSTGNLQKYDFYLYAESGTNWAGSYDEQLLVPDTTTLIDNNMMIKINGLYIFENATQSNNILYLQMGSTSSPVTANMFPDYGYLDIKKIG